MSARELKDALANGEVSVSEVTQVFLGRIRDENARLGAFTFVDEAGAIARAAQLDKSRPSSTEPLPLLWGLPFADKDLSARVGVPTGHGSRAGGEVAEHSDPEVLALDAAGAVSLGKTSTSEFGLFGYTSPRAGAAARHPDDDALGTGGSSGGAAAAVAAKLLPFAPGSDGGGSVRIPAASVGIVGVKPSRALLAIDRESAGITGVVTGSLARSVPDAALLLDGLNAHTGQAGPRAKNFSDALQQPLGQLRVGMTSSSPWHREFDIPVHPEVLRAFERAANHIEQLGGVALESEVRFPSERYGDIFLTAWQRSAASINQRFDRSLMEPVTQQQIAAGDALSEEQRARNDNDLRRFGDAVAELLSERDIVLTPALAQPYHFVDGWSDDAETNFHQQVLLAPYSSWVNVAGLPAITLPTPVRSTSPSGASIPISIQLIGQRGRDAQLLAFAAAVEASFSHEFEEPQQ
jgi:amidase